MRNDARNLVNAREICLRNQKNDYPGRVLSRYEAKCSAARDHRRDSPRDCGQDERGEDFSQPPRTRYCQAGGGAAKSFQLTILFSLSLGNDCQGRRFQKTGRTRTGGRGWIQGLDRQTSNNSRKTQFLAHQLICRERRLIPGRDNPGIFDHQNDGSVRCARAMQHTFGNDKSLSGREVDRSLFQINQQPALDNIEKLVVIIVLVPMILALDHANANDRRVDLAERLIEPRLTGVRKRFLIDHLQRSVQNIKSRIVGEILDVAHRKSWNGK